MSKLQKLLTFNEDNKDVYEQLNQKSNASQYVCEAVRFYERHKNFMTSMQTIEEKTDRILERLEQQPLQLQTKEADRKEVMLDDELRQLILQEED